MRFRSGAIVGTLGTALGLLAFLLLLGLAVPDARPATRVFVGVAGVLAAAMALRLTVVGVEIAGGRVVIRSMWWTRRFAQTDIAGLAVEPVLRRRLARLAVVRRDGEIVPVIFATWRMGRHPLQRYTWHAAALLAAGTPAADPAAVVEAAGRLEHRAAFTVQVPDGRLVAVPAVTRDPGLVPARRPRPAVSYLGIETAAVTAAFVLPAAVTAIAVFARHVARVSNLDQFALPLPGNPAGSLVLLVLLYLTTAVVTPIALLLLARTGQTPAVLGLSPGWLRADALPGLGLLLGVWLTLLVVVAPLSPFLDHGSVTNVQHNTSVPAYFVVYALVVSLTTAVNEEVIVNGFLLTRLTQLGWQPWPAFALSLALRTSYHAYYGLALIGTIPFGVWATRSFQKHGRLGRPIVAHFLNDAIILTAAVLTS